MKKVRSSMAKMDRQLSLIANNLVAGAYASSAELKKVLASLGNASATCANAKKMMKSTVSTKAKLVKASEDNEFDETMEGVLSNQMKAEILTDVVNSELEDMQEQEELDNVSDEIETESFGEEDTELDGDEAVTTESHDFVQNPDGPVNDGEITGDTSVGEIAFETESEDLGEGTEDEISLEDPDAETMDVVSEVEDFLDEPEVDELTIDDPAVEDEPEQIEQATSASQRATASDRKKTLVKASETNSLSNIWSFKS